jgi:hypothetical protein
MKSQEEINLQQKQRRKENNNLYTKTYEKTINGFLMRVYRNMKSRIEGIQKHKAHLYKDKDILDKVDFLSWVDSSCSFYILYKRWVKSNYSRKLCPTVDRLDSTLGYTLCNMQWITHSENSRKGSISRWQK